MRFCARVDRQDPERAGETRRHRLRPSTGTTRRRERGDMRQPFDAWLELHERAEVRHARDAAGADLAHLVVRGNRGPRIVEQLLQPERDLLRGLVHAQHLDGDLIARRDDLAGPGAARPAHFRHVEQTLDAAAQVDEGAELGHRDDASGEHRAGHDRLAHVRGAGALFLFEVLAP